jgi:hypothetical protein
MAEALIALRDYEAVHEAAMLSTCGRIEIYAEIEDYEAGVEQLRAFLRNFRHADVEVDMSSYLYTLLGEEAIEHFFRVSTGLDSMRALSRGAQRGEGRAQPNADRQPINERRDRRDRARQTRRRLARR